jgi:hypothetical protein
VDNVFVERLWRTVKYEDIYLWRYEAVSQLQQGLLRYFRITTRRVCTRAWITEPRQACMGRGEPEEGRRGEEGAFFFAPPSLSLCEGSAVRKRMPGGRAEGKRRLESGALRYCS